MLERVPDPGMVAAQRQMLADSGAAGILTRVLSTPEFLLRHGLAVSPDIAVGVDPAGYCLTTRWPVDSSSGYMSHLSEQERVKRDLHNGVSVRPDIGRGRLTVSGTPVYSVDPSDHQTLEAIIRQVCFNPAVSIITSADGLPE